MPRRQVVAPSIRSAEIAAWGNDCWLELPGCTKVGTEDDHIVPHAHGGKDTVPNLRRACKHCNASRQDRVLYGYGCRLHMIVCPPGSCDREAVDYIAQHAKPTDPVVSWASLAAAMRVDEADMEQRRAVAMAWSAAYRQFAKSRAPLDVWLVRTLPRSRRHPDMLAEWLALDYDVHVIETPADSTFALDLTPQEYRTAQQWYALHLTQQAVDARLAARRQRLAALGLRRDSPAARPRW